MLLSDSRYVHQIEAEVAPFKGALLSLFFVAVGMSMDLPRLATEAPSVAAALALLLLVKGVLMLALARASGLPPAVAVRVAFLLPQAGEFAFVLFAAAAAAGLLGNAVHQAALLVILLSMAATPLLSLLGDRLARRLEHVADHGAEPALANVTLDRHVVLAGFGRVGRNIAFMLEQAQIPYLALDVDVSRVALGRREGRPVYFGSSTDPRVLAQAGVGRAAAIVVTLDSTSGVQKVVDTIRSLHPHVPVFVRARDLGERDRLIEAGVSEAIPETIQLSTSLGEAVLRRVGAPEEQVQAVVEALRQDNYANLRLGAIRGRMAEVGRREGAS
jgi:glutathione-regulated potassium-efflux system ancillary protein KefC